MKEKIIKILGIASVALVVYVFSFYFLVITQIIFFDGIKQFSEVFYKPIFIAQTLPSKIALSAQGYNFSTVNYNIIYGYQDSDDLRPSLIKIDSINVSDFDSRFGEYIPASNARYYIDSREVSQQEFADEEKELQITATKSLQIGGVKKESEDRFTFNKARFQSN